MNLGVLYRFKFLQDHEAFLPSAYKEKFEISKATFFRDLESFNLVEKKSFIYNPVTKLYEKTENNYEC